MIQLVREQATDYNSFVQTITRNVKEMMGEGYTAKVYKVTKNNSLALDSLVVLKEGENFAPNVYLMPYYESFLEGTSLQEITDRLCCIYQQCAVPIVEKNFTYAFEEMKSYIVYRLVSYERNDKLLSEIPHIKYLDLAITYHCLVRSDDEGIGTIRITNDHMNMWETTLAEINALAMKNTCKLFPSSIHSMEEVIKGILQEEFMQEGLGNVPDNFMDNFTNNSVATNQYKMYILSNHKGINGAACLLYENVLSEFADRINSDFYILPSSIHEIIIIPYSKELNKEALSEMVKEVNCTQVARDEILSDKVYYYSKEHNAIMM